MDRFLTLQGWTLPAFLTGYRARSEQKQQSANQNTIVDVRHVHLNEICEMCSWALILPSSPYKKRRRDPCVNYQLVIKRVSFIEGFQAYLELAGFVRMRRNSGQRRAVEG